MLVAERIVPDVGHAAENEAVLPVDLAVQVHAQPLRRQFVEQRFERVEVIVAEEGQDRGLPGAAHRAQAVGQHREELALAVEAAALGQQITGDQDEAGLFLFDDAHQVAPLSDALMEIGGDDELRGHGCRYHTGDRPRWRPQNPTGAGVRGSQGRSLSGRAAHRNQNGGGYARL